MPEARTKRGRLVWPKPARRRVHLVEVRARRRCVMDTRLHANADAIVAGSAADVEQRAADQGLAMGRQPQITDHRRRVGRQCAV